MVLLFLAFAVLFKRPSVTRETVTLLNARLDSLQEEVSSLRSALSSLPARDHEGGGGGSSAPVAAVSDSDAFLDSVGQAPKDWRFCVVRGEPCVSIRDRYLLCVGHRCRFGLVQAITPECLVTDRGVFAFGGYTDG